VIGFYAGETFKSSEQDTWTTPKSFFAALNEEFDFKLDAAALQSSALCNLWYGPDHPQQDWRDAFARDWQADAQGNIWLNPPYGNTIKKWIAKANDEASLGGELSCA
jgi:site-specific DNA-methyltransferase (adenine-specific)